MVPSTAWPDPPTEWAGEASTLFPVLGGGVRTPRGWCTQPGHSSSSSHQISARWWLLSCMRSLNHAPTVHRGWQLGRPTRYIRDSHAG